MPSVGGSHPGHRVPELLDPAWRMRWRAPELSLMLSDRAAAYARHSGDRALRLRAEALALFSANRLGKGVAATERAIAALRDARSSGDSVSSAELSVELASCARRSRVHDVALRVLQPVLEQEQLAPDLRADALIEFAHVVPVYGRESERAEALDEAERLYAAATELDRDTVELMRARLRAVRAAHHRRLGEFDDAVRAARSGLALLERLGDPAADSGEVCADLVLELVHALLDQGLRAEALEAARRILTAAVRAATAEPAGWLRVALATRVHEPAGDHGRRLGLLTEASATAERHDLVALLAESLNALSCAHEQEQDFAAALRYLRGAHAADRRWRAMVEAARTRLLTEFPAHTSSVPEQGGAARRRAAMPAGNNGGTSARQLMDTVTGRVSAGSGQADALLADSVTVNNAGTSPGPDMPVPRRSGRRAAHDQPDSPDTQPRPGRRARREDNDAGVPGYSGGAGYGLTESFGPGFAAATGEVETSAQAGEDRASQQQPASAQGVGGGAGQHSRHGAWTADASEDGVANHAAGDSAEKAVTPPAAPSARHQASPEEPQLSPPMFDADPYRLAANVLGSESETPRFDPDEVNPVRASAPDFSSLLAGSSNVRPGEDRTGDDRAGESRQTSNNSERQYLPEDEPGYRLDTEDPFADFPTLGPSSWSAEPDSTQVRDAGAGQPRADSPDLTTIMPVVPPLPSEDAWPRADHGASSVSEPFEAATTEAPPLDSSQMAGSRPDDAPLASSPAGASDVSPGDTGESSQPEWRSLAEIRAGLRLVQGSPDRGSPGSTAVPGLASGDAADSESPAPERADDGSGEDGARHRQVADTSQRSQEQNVNDRQDVGLADLLAEALMAYEDGRRNQRGSYPVANDADRAATRRENHHRYAADQPVVGRSDRSGGSSTGAGHTTGGQAGSGQAGGDPADTVGVGRHSATVPDLGRAGGRRARASVDEDVVGSRARHRQPASDAVDGVSWTPPLS